MQTTATLITFAFIAGVAVKFILNKTSKDRFYALFSINPDGHAPMVESKVKEKLENLHSKIMTLKHRIAEHQTRGLRSMSSKDSEDHEFGYESLDHDLSLAEYNLRAAKRLARHFGYLVENTKNTLCIRNTAN